MIKKAVVFDLDGTLLNTLEDLTDSTNSALRYCGYPERTIDEIRRFVGNGIYKLIERAVPKNTDSENTKKCYDFFCADYKKNMANKTKPYDGVDGLLKNLYDAGLKLAIVTNKADFAAQELCGSLFGKYVKVVVGSDGVRPNKPAPDGVYYALSKLGVSKEESVFVGDSEVDIATAKNADIDCIGVLWGFRDKKDLEKVGVTKTAATAAELQNMLLF